jgi:hypothetical protein
MSGWWRPPEGLITKKDQQKPNTQSMQGGRYKGTSDPSIEESLSPRSDRLTPGDSAEYFTLDPLDPLGVSAYCTCVGEESFEDVQLYIARNGDDMVGLSPLSSHPLASSSSVPRTTAPPPTSLHQKPIKQLDSSPINPYHFTTKQAQADMRVLLLGATGNLGLRLIPALLTHNHTVIAYVRSPSKLQSLLPASIHENIAVIQGDATDSHAIKQAILENKCSAVVNTAGVAALAPWATSDLPEIFRTIVGAVSEAGAEIGSPLRAWVLGGQGVLFYPGTRSMLSKL